MKSSFLKRIEPALLSEDPFVQHYAITILGDSYLSTPATLFTALQAFDNTLTGNFPSSILPHITFMPVDEKGLLELLTRIEKNDEHKKWFVHLLQNASTELLLQYQKRVERHLSSKFMKSLKQLKTLDIEGLFMEFGRIMNELEDDGYSQTLYDFGKRIVKELIYRQEIFDWEVENGIRNNMTEYQYMRYDGIFNIYMAGELRTETVVPDLIKLLNKDEGDLVHEEATRSLIKIGTETVIKEIEKIALNEDTFYYTIDVLAKIKTNKAEEALLRLFDQASDISMKTIIADALCQHLSTAAIPRVEKLLESGFDATMLNLEESLYVNLVLNKVNHPYLAQMKYNLEEEERHFNEVLEKQAVSVKVGRNDPCPCGSGKKHKKCCM